MRNAITQIRQAATRLRQQADELDKKAAELEKGTLKPRTVTPKNKDYTCKHCQKTSELFINSKPCRGYKIKCNHPKGHGEVLISKAMCNQEKCNYYEM